MTWKGFCKTALNCYIASVSLVKLKMKKNTSSISQGLLHFLLDWFLTKARTTSCIVGTSTNTTFCHSFAKTDFRHRHITSIDLYKQKKIGQKSRKTKRNSNVCRTTYYYYLINGNNYMDIPAEFTNWVLD